MRTKRRANGSKQKVTMHWIAIHSK